MSNFLFLKKHNENLFNIIAEAEKLFKDEYFEQSIVQTRRFAENLCKDFLGDKMLPEETFDSMINRIKDKSFENIRLKEFTDDLFFIKKHGNVSAHSSNPINDGKVALECLERAFEISIFYFNSKNGYNKKLDKTNFSEELLMTGKKEAPKTLQQTYSKKLNQTRTEAKINRKKSKNISNKNANLKPSKRKEKQGKNIPLTPFFIIIFLLIIILGHYFL